MIALLLFLPLVSAQTFAPGCSFFNGQCVYNVKLGHSGQCDDTSSQISHTTSSGTGTPSFSGGCTCSDVSSLKNDLSTLQSTLNTIQGNMDKLNNQLNLTKGELTKTNSQLQSTTHTHSNLLSELHSKEELLNRTKEELASVLLEANNEIHHLREQLNNASRDLVACNPSGTPATPAVSSEYTLTYCPFESSLLCGFTQDHSDNADYGHYKGRLHSSTGPTEDHTYQSPKGYYVGLDPSVVASSSHQTHTAKLLSPVLPAAPNYCIRFWYHLYGADVDTFSVYVKVGGGYGYPIFSKKQGGDNQWHLAEISLNKEYTGKDFQIAFEATTDAYRSYIYSGGHSVYHYYHTNGVVAFDDFYAYNTSCNDVPDCPPHAYQRVYKGRKSCLTFNPVPQSWYTANQECKKQSAQGHLMAIKDSQTQQYIIQLIQSDIGLMSTGQSGYYISANDEAAEQSFVWTDSGAPNAVNYTNWYPGQPNNVGSNQDCVMLQYPDADYEWGDVDCNEKHPYICEINY